MTNDIKILLLDLDGTLLDFKANESHALETVFANLGYELTEEIKNTYMEINHGLWKRYELGEITRDEVVYTRFGKLFEAVGIDGDGVFVEKEYQSLLSEGDYELPGARELLDYLEEKYDLYVVTNGVAKTQWKRLRSSGFDKYMKDIFISEELGCQKPQKEFFDICFGRIGKVDKSKVMVIGDSLTSDMKGGNVAGIKTLWINMDGQERNPEIPVDYEVDSLEKIKEIL